MPKNKGRIIVDGKGVGMTDEEAGKLVDELQSSKPYKKVI